MHLKFKFDSTYFLLAPWCEWNWYMNPSHFRERFSNSIYAWQLACGWSIWQMFFTFELNAFGIRIHRWTVFQACSPRLIFWQDTCPHGHTIIQIASEEGASEADLFLPDSRIHRTMVFPQSMNRRAFYGKLRQSCFFYIIHGSNGPIFNRNIHSGSIFHPARLLYPNVPSKSFERIWTNFFGATKNLDPLKKKKHTSKTAPAVLTFSSRFLFQCLQPFEDSTFSIGIPTLVTDCENSLLPTSRGRNQNNPSTSRNGRCSQL